VIALMSFDAPAEVVAATVAHGAPDLYLAQYTLLQASVVEEEAFQCLLRHLKQPWHWVLVAVVEDPQQYSWNADFVQLASVAAAVVRG
jgi:hypothetical protein